MSSRIHAQALPDRVDPPSQFEEHELVTLEPPTQFVSAADPSMAAVGISRPSKRICVIGSGHVGTVTAAGLSWLGHSVVAIDRSAALVDTLTAGLIPFHEPDLADMVSSGLGRGTLTFTTDYAPIATADFVFLAVDTPQTLGGAADLRNIRSAATAIAENLGSVTPTVVNKSTSPIGTGETIAAILTRKLAQVGAQVPIVANPEFLRQGHAVHDFLHPDRIVVGSQSRERAQAVASLFEELGGEVVITDLRTAEMIKYVSNSYLATRVSFINEIARLCEALSVDVDDVIGGIRQDPRIGAHYLSPGIGFGGSCLPKDVAALRYMGEALGVATHMLAAVEEVNESQRTSVVRKLRSLLGGLDGKVIGVWGLTFKGETEDLRDSPAMDVVRLLLNEGATIRAFDPAVSKMTHNTPDWLTPHLVEGPMDAARGADAVAVLADWPEFAQLPLRELRSEMAGDVLFDGRNTLDASVARDCGFRYAGVGRPHLVSRKDDSV